MGGDITYATIPSTTAGVPRYHVVVRQFTTPSTPVIVNPLTLVATNGSCGGVATNITMPLTQTLNGAHQACTSTAPFYLVSLYEADVDLPTGQWTLSNTTSAWTSGVQNIPGSTLQSLYISAYLDNTTTVQDTSPKFESVLEPIISVSASAPHSFSAFDADGDSLRYEVVAPAGGCGQPLVSTPAPHFVVNTATGALEPTAATTSTQGYYSLSVRVSEYRKLSPNRWVLLGYVNRDLLYTVYATTNLPPTFTGLSVNGGASRSPSLPILIQPGQTTQVTLTASDPDAGQLLRFTSGAPNVVPGLSLTTLGATQVKLTWQVPAGLPPGRYAIPVAVLDNGCTTNASEDRTLLFIVGGSQPLASRASSSAATDVYPVPFREQVQFTTAPNQAVVLVDALGREVARLTSAADGRVRWLPASSLPAGLYLARSAADGRALARLLRAGE
ncbi:MAG: T9SS type A sorting domain-containing protein [Hymenobacter sp.]|nr:MAG: T9SS type A sorting domain-containing protein [Hymenobacter sp.]